MSVHWFSPEYISVGYYAIHVLRYNIIIANAMVYETLMKCDFKYMGEKNDEDFRTQILINRFLVIFFNHYFQTIAIQVKDGLWNIIGASDFFPF